MNESSELPQTIDEAVAQLLTALSPAQQEELRGASYLDLLENTWYLQAWVRAAFDLWGRDDRPLRREQLETTGDPDKDLCLDLAHPLPDDISLAIVKAAWQRLQGNR